jgi:hypothetical protein
VTCDVQEREEIKLLRSQLHASRFQEREEIKLLRSQLHASRQKHDIAVARFEAELKVGRDEIAQLRERDIKILRRQLQEGEKRYAELEKAMTKLQVALQVTDDKLAKSEQSKQALSVELIQKVETASQERDDAITRGEATSSKLKAATDAVQQLKRDLATCQTTGKELQVQLNTVAAEAQALCKERDEAKADAAAARKELEALAAKFEDAAADAEKESKAKFADMEQKHSKEKSAADDAYKKQLANLHSALEGSMGEQGKKMQAELEALRKKAAADLDSLRAVHQQESDASAKKAADAMSAAQSRHDQELQDEAAKSASDLAKVSEERDDLSAKIAAGGADAQNHSARVRQLEDELAKLQQQVADLRREAVAASQTAVTAAAALSAEKEAALLELADETAGKRVAEARAADAVRDKADADARILQLEQQVADLRREAEAAAAKVLADASNGITGFYPVPAAPEQGGMSDDDYIAVCHRRYFYHLLREVSPSPPHCLQHPKKKFPMTPANSLQLHVLGTPPPRSHAQGSNPVRLHYSELSTAQCPCPAGWSTQPPAGLTRSHMVDGQAGQVRWESGQSPLSDFNPANRHSRYSLLRWEHDDCPRGVLGSPVAAHQVICWAFRGPAPVDIFSPTGKTMEVDHFNRCSCAQFWVFIIY